MRSLPDKHEVNSLQSSPRLGSEQVAGGGSAFRQADQRPQAITQRRLQALVDNSSRVNRLLQLQAMADAFVGSRQVPQYRQEKAATPRNALQQIDAIQKKGIVQLKKVTVRNNTDTYTSGWVTSESQSTGVDQGPQDEANRVQSIAGGTWYGGHMVNDRLGGHGGHGNIVPVTSSMNGKHKTIENAARGKVGNGLGSYAVKYDMNILSRRDFNFGNGDEVKNLPHQFYQQYHYRLKNGGPVTTVNGNVLDMFDNNTLQFI